MSGASPVTPPRRWVVTGASRGIGRAIAERALAAGDRVCLVARSEEIARDAALLGDQAMGERGDRAGAGDEAGPVLGAGGA